MENTTSFFGGFESIAGSLSDRTVGKGTISGDYDPEDGKYEIKDPAELEDQDGDDDQNVDKNFKDDNKGNAGGSSSDDDDSDNSDDDSPASKDSDGEGFTDISEAEPEITQFVQEKLSKALGIDFDNESKFETIDEVVEYLKELVEVSSEPQFANEDIKKLNEFVSNGGKVEDYIKTAYGDLDVNTLDLKSETNQKAVIKELLKEKGYNEARIKRSIERYEDAGTLAEEAEDAKEMLLEVREEKSEKLLKDKEKEKVAQVEQQQKYVQSVEQTVNTLESVRGIPISSTEKKQLLDYIFKPTADGHTRYQKDYMSSSKNLIESAYFTMKGDAFIQKVQRKANSDAAINLKKKLASKGKDTKGSQDNSSLAWNLLSSQLRKNK